MVELPELEAEAEPVDEVADEVVVDELVLETKTLDVMDVVEANNVVGVDWEGGNEEDDSTRLVAVPDFALDARIPDVVATAVVITVVDWPWKYKFDQYEGAGFETNQNCNFTVRDDFTVLAVVFGGALTTVAVVLTAPPAGDFYRPIDPQASLLSRWNQ